MPSKPTSVAAYRDLIDSGKGRLVRDKIFKCIMQSSDVGIVVTRDQLEALTEVRINVVCGAVHALLEMDMIRVAYEGKNEATGRVVEYLEICPIVRPARQFQPELFDLRQVETRQKSRLEYQHQHVRDVLGLNGS